VDAVDRSDGSCLCGKAYDCLCHYSFLSLSQGGRSPFLLPGLTLDLGGLVGLDERIPPGDLAEG